MGCRPSKQATSKVRASDHKDGSRCLCSPRKARKSHRCSSASNNSGRNSADGSGKPTVRQCFSNSHRPGSSKSADLDFPAFSTTSAVYRTSASRTSRITLRLSCDGSTLEIEQCDYDLEKVRGEGESKPRPWNSAPNLTKLRSSKSRLFVDYSYMPIQHSSSGWSPHFTSVSCSRGGFARVPVQVSSPDESVTGGPVSSRANSAYHHKGSMGHALESSTFPAKTFGKTSLSRSQTSSAFSSSDERRPLLLDILKESRKTAAVEGNVNKAASPASYQASSSLGNVSPAFCQASGSLGNDGPASCQTSSSLDNMINKLECSLESSHHVTHLGDRRPCSLEFKVSELRDNNGHTWSCACELPKFGESNNRKHIPVKVTSSLISCQGQEIADSSPHSDLDLAPSDLDVCLHVHSHEATLTDREDAEPPVPPHCPTLTSRPTRIQTNNSSWTGPRGSSLSGSTMTSCGQGPGPVSRSSPGVVSHLCSFSGPVSGADQVHVVSSSACVECSLAATCSSGGRLVEGSTRGDDTDSSVQDQHSLSTNRSVLLGAPRVLHNSQFTGGPVRGGFMHETRGDLTPRPLLQIVEWTRKESQCTLLQEKECQQEPASRSEHLHVAPSFSRSSAIEDAQLRQRAARGEKLMAQSVSDGETEEKFIAQSVSDGETEEKLMAQSVSDGETEEKLMAQSVSDGETDESWHLDLNRDDAPVQLVGCVQRAGRDDENSGDVHLNGRVTCPRSCFGGGADHTTGASRSIHGCVGPTTSEIATAFSCFRDEEADGEVWSELEHGGRHDQLGVIEDAGYLVALLCPPGDTRISSLNSSSVFSCDCELLDENYLSTDTSNNETAYSGRLGASSKLEENMSGPEQLDSDQHNCHPWVPPRARENIVCRRLEVVDVGAACTCSDVMQMFGAMTAEGHGRVRACPLGLLHHRHVIAADGDCTSPLWNETNVITPSSNVIHGNWPHNWRDNERDNSGDTALFNEIWPRDSTRNIDTHVQQNGGHDMSAGGSPPLVGNNACPGIVCSGGNLVACTRHNLPALPGIGLVEGNHGDHSRFREHRTMTNLRDRRQSDKDMALNYAGSHLYRLSGLWERPLGGKSQVCSSGGWTDEPSSREKPTCLCNGNLRSQVTSQETAWSYSATTGPASVRTDSRKRVGCGCEGLVVSLRTNSQNDEGLACPVSSCGVCPVSSRGVCPHVQSLFASPESLGHEHVHGGNGSMAAVDVAGLSTSQGASGFWFMDHSGYPGSRPEQGTLLLHGHPSGRPNDGTHPERLNVPSGRSIGGTHPERLNDPTGRPNDDTHPERPNDGTHPERPNDGTHPERPNDGTHPERPNDGTHPERLDDPTENQDWVLRHRLVGESVSPGVATSTCLSHKLGGDRGHSILEPLAVSPVGADRWRGGQDPALHSHYVPRNNVLSLVRYFEKAPYSRHGTKQ